MSKQKTIASIELGSSKTVVIIAQQGSDDPNADQDTVNIVGVASIPSKGIKKAQIVNIEEVVETSVSAIEACERMAGYNLDAAYVAMGGASILSQNSHGVVAVSNPEGEINIDDTERVIEAASAISLPSSREVLHVIPREYIVDGEGGVKDPVGMSGVRLEVDTHIVTASSASIKNLKKAINEIGVNIDSLVYTGLAASEAVLTRTEKELGCALIDIGGGTTSLSVFVDGALSHSAVIPIGAANVTNDLAIGLRVSLEAAERIKLFLSDKKKQDDGENLDLTKIGITELKKVSRKTLVEGIVRPRLNEIFTMVRIELEKAGLDKRIPSGAILTGGGALTVGAEESAKRMLLLPSRVGKPKGVTGLIDDVLTPAFAVPVGLLLFGAKNLGGPRERNKSNPFPKVNFPKVHLGGKIIELIKDLLP